jgi:hypothetical protein
VEDGHLVGPDHREFVVGSDGGEDEADAAGRPELGPCGFVGGVEVQGDVVRPVYARGFGVADVGYVVDVLLEGCG